MQIDKIKSLFQKLEEQHAVDDIQDEFYVEIVSEVLALGIDKVDRKEVRKFYYQLQQGKTLNYRHERMNAGGIWLLVTLALLAIVLTMTLFVTIIGNKQPVIEVFYDSSQSTEQVSILNEPSPTDSLRSPSPIPSQNLIGTTQKPNTVTPFIITALPSQESIIQDTGDLINEVIITRNNSWLVVQIGDKFDDLTFLISPSGISHQLNIDFGLPQGSDLNLSGLCFAYKIQETNEPIPENNCESINSILDMSVEDVFWYENGKFTIMTVLDGRTRLGVCVAEANCVIIPQ